jgi:hypothetical protein
VEIRSPLPFIQYLGYGIVGYFERKAIFIGLTGKKVRRVEGDRNMFGEGCEDVGRLLDLHRDKADIYSK